MPKLRVLPFLWVLLSSSVASAQTHGAPDCSNPRAALATLFDWLQPDSYDPVRASTCLALPDGVTGAKRAVQLKQLLDARGLWVPVSSMPSDPAHRDELGRAQVVPMEDFPVLVVEQGDDGQWRIARQTVLAIPQLYASTFSPLSLWFQSALPDLFQARLLGLFLWQYLYAVLLVFASWVAGLCARLLLRGQVFRALRKAHLTVDPATYARTNAPVVVWVMLCVVYAGLTDLQLGIRASHALHAGVWVALWVVGILALSRFVNVGAQVAKSWAVTTHSKLDDQAIPLVRQATQVALFTFGVLYVADAAGLDVWQLAAGVGIGGLAFALAAQDTVANVFGSINIFVDRPFQIGDWVQMCGVEGVVEEVGFRSTRVRTFYNSLVTIPNSQITNANVDNLGLRPRRRIKLTLGLTYDTPPDKLQAYVEGIRAILAAHPQVQRSYEVHFYNLGASAQEILVYYHVVTADWHDELVARSQTLQEFVRLAHELGVSFAFPSTSVYVASTPDHPLPPHPDAPLEQLQTTYDAFGPGGRLARPGGTPFERSWSVKARDRQDSRGSAE